MFENKGTLVLKTKSLRLLLRHIVKDVETIKIYYQDLCNLFVIKKKVPLEVLIFLMEYISDPNFLKDKFDFSLLNLVTSNPECSVESVKLLFEYVAEIKINVFEDSPFANICLQKHVK